MKCSDVSDRLVDFLYEEMPAAERREFVAHVDGCAACSAEVTAMSSTLGHARAALRGPLDEAPPPNLRARILQAAEAATTAKVVQTSRVGSPPASPAAHHRGRDGEAERSERGGGGGWGAEGRSEPSQGSHVNVGFFARLWRTPWLVPALGAAGVATVVLLVRVIKNPQVFPEQKPAATETLAQPAAEPRVLPQAQPPAEGKPTLPSPSGLALAKRRTAKSEDNSYSELRHAVEPEKPHSAARAPGKLGTAGRRFVELSNEPLGGAGEDLQAPVGAAATAKGGFRAAAPSKAPAGAIARPESAPATRADKDESLRDRAQNPMPDGRSRAVGAGAGSSARWAEPPPPRPAFAPVAAAPSPRPVQAAPAVFAATPASAEPAPARKTKSAEDLLDSAAQKPVRSPERAKAQTPARVSAASPAAQAEASADKREVSENKHSISLEERVRKAEKLFAEKKWAEAAAAFRALIAQAPSHPAVKTWRERLAAAEGAQEQGRAAKAKKAGEGDSLDGL